MKVIAKHSQLSGAITVPGSKSHTIRACLFSGLAKGISHVYNPLPSEDCLSAVRLIRSFGCKVDIKPREWVIEGIGAPWPQPGFVVDVGDSGTLLSFATGIAGTLPGYSVITGDASICKRPIKDLLEGLKQAGAEAFTTRESVDAPPAIIKGPIHAATVKEKGILSQHVSGMLMAGALTPGKTRIALSEPKEIPFVMMTVEWLESVGIHVNYDHEKHMWYEISGPNTFPTIDRTIPSDWEGVAFPVVAALLTGSEITVEHVDVTSSQGDKAIINVLASMGADIDLDVRKEHLIVHPSSHFHGITVSLSDFPDALPALSVFASFAKGDTKFTDIGVCRLKESDRIELMHKELGKLGVPCDEGPDYLVVHGTEGKGIHGGVVESYGDHRIAMAFACMGLALRHNETLTINNAECCAVSFPHFFETMNKIHAGFEIVGV